MRALVLALAALAVAALGHAGPVQPSDLERFKADIARTARDGSWWLTSNAEYADQDGGMEAYATRYWLELGEVASSGCLWGIRDGRPANVFWHFFTAWDGASGRPFFYQSHASGGTGFGWEVSREKSTVVMEQEFRWPDGSGQRIRHRTEHVGDSIQITTSENWTDGQWVKGRTYTWHRQPAGTTPCGPPAG